ncbi:dienelactone hydrolase [Metarhizium album ARSEF 1941]|uniref:Dienelactone hydrolase n=1 Tax=Metarhizium album (strain ARSEF 1941) TaxID=1081103 RepID=A0A0B2WR11_METAS|nr:dienelactone hydrolase [Metarhizium album ARSEF 1941]KHN95932.1 dienelactone hydrolase [Metarhizium album ARSEF 1941]
MASNAPARCCTLGSLFEGKPAGKLIKIDNKIDAYVATPPDGKAHNGCGILYVPDVIGIWQNSQLMADLFAEQGYTTVVLDLFNGDPVKLNRPDGFDFMAWLSKGTDGNNPHTAPYVDPVVEAGIKYIQGLGITKLGAVGYCFGAKSVIRHYKDGIDVGFVAHPSFVEEDELAAIGGPLSIAAAETDDIFPSDKRHKSEEILKATKKPYQINLYSGVEHGFAVRGDLKVKAQRFAKEQAFLQAVTWFENYLLQEDQ